MSKSKPSTPAPSASGRDTKVAKCVRRLRDIAMNQSPLVCVSELDRLSETAAPGHADKVAASLGVSSGHKDDSSDAADSDEPDDSGESPHQAVSETDWRAQEAELASLIFPEAA